MTQKSAIIRPVVKRDYVALPNEILADRRLSIETRGMLCFILSKSRGWEIRPYALAKALSTENKRLGRTKLDRMIQEAMTVGYIARSEAQSRKDDGSFGRYAYLCGMPENVKAELERQRVAFLPHARNPHTGDPHTGDPHTGDPHTGFGSAHSKKIQTSKNTELKNHEHHQSGHPSLPLHATAKGSADESYSALGLSARSAGMQFVFAGSEPFKAWRAFRGEDGMPLIDIATIEGREHRGCWFPSLYPPRSATDDRS